MNKYVKFRTRYFSDSRKIEIHWGSNFLNNYCIKGCTPYLYISYNQDILESKMCFNHIIIILLVPIINILARQEGFSVDIEFDSSINRNIYNLLSSYYGNFDNINVVSEMADQIDLGISQAAKQKIGILFGGGKDTLGSMELLRRLYPDAEVYILRKHFGRGSVYRNKRIFEQNVLPQVTSFLSGTDKYFSTLTNIHMVFDRSLVKSLTLGLYIGSMLPLLIKENFILISYTFDALEFDASQKYALSRTTHVKLLNSILEHCGLKTKVRNISCAIPAYLHFDIILRLNPALLNAISMCEQLSRYHSGSHWCYNCQKCFTFMIYCLARQLKIDGYNIPTMLKSDQFCSIVKSIRSVQRMQYVDKTICYPYHFEAFCHLVSEIDIGYVKNEYGVDCANQIQIIIDKYAKPNKALFAYWYHAGIRENESDAKKISNILTEHNIDTFYDSEVDLLVHNKLTHYDMSLC